PEVVPGGGFLRPFARAVADRLGLAVEGERPPGVAQGAVGVSQAVQGRAGLALPALGAEEGQGLLVGAACRRRLAALLQRLPAGVGALGRVPYPLGGGREPGGEERPQGGGEEGAATAARRGGHTPRSSSSACRRRLRGGPGSPRRPGSAGSG